MRRIFFSRLPRRVLLVSLAVGAVPSGVAAQARIAVVEPGGPAEKGGLLRGDTILSWVREPNPPDNPQPARGEIRSAFDLLWVEFEHGPRGPVTLTGLRGTEKKTWTISSGIWRVRLIALTPPELRTAANEASALLEANRPEDALNQWRTVADAMTDRPSAAYLILSAARALGGRGFNDLANETFAQAVDMGRPDNHIVMWRAAHEWSEFLRLRKDMEAALARLKLALTEARLIGPESLAEALVLVGCGLVERERKNLDAAADYYRQALAIEEKQTPSSRRDRAATRRSRRSRRRTR